MKKVRTLIMILFASMIADMLIGSAAHANKIDYDTHPYWQWRITREKMHLNSMRMDVIVRLLAIKPGMTVLDIGTGTGQIAFVIAETLRASGKIFVTDTSAECIGYVKQEAKRRGLTDLLPVVVKKEGFDEFYKKQSYDLITLFHVSRIKYEDSVGYFKEMRSTLKPKGKLFVMFEKTFPPFSADDLADDLNGLVKELSQEPKDSPFYKYLRNDMRTLIKQHSGNRSDEKLRSAIAGYFNAILSDNDFFSNFVDGSGLKRDLKFAHEEREMAERLLHNITFRIKYNKGDKESFKHINKLFIIQRFRQYLNKERMFPPKFGKKVRETLEKAGYTLEQEYHDLIPFEDIYIFTVDRSMKQQ